MHIVLFVLHTEIVIFINLQISSINFFMYLLFGNNYQVHKH